MVPSIMASRPGPEAAKQPQTITLSPPCLTVGIMFCFMKSCVGFTPDVMGHIPCRPLLVGEPLLGSFLHFCL